MKNTLAKMVCTTLALGFLAMPSVQAAEENTEFSLDKVIVTALRSESKDLTTPAYVHVLSNEQLKATGATTLVEALKFQEGFAYYSQNPRGHSNGGMSSRIIIRGVEKGTLVLLNGVPLNLNGWYQLDSIPLDNIERVEVVSGGGSVLYGSEASGGVINIITKKAVDNSFTTSFGSYGQQDHSLNLQVGKLAFNVNYSEIGTVDRITGVKAQSTSMGTTVPANYTNYDGNERTNISATYVFDSHLTMRYENTQDYIHRSYRNNANGSLLTQSSGPKAPTALMYDDDRKDVFTAMYNNKELKFNAFYNRRELFDRSTTAAGAISSSTWTDTVEVMGFDTQNTWHNGFGKLLAGVGYQREAYQKEINAGATNNPYPVGPLDRNNYSLYVQQTRDFNPQDTLILGARQQWVSDENSKNQSVLLPQLQFLHRSSDSRTWFVDINKSFRMPTFAELYANYQNMPGLYPNPDLKPESGWSYETGWKHQLNDASFKAALFYMEIDDQIAYKADTPSPGRRQAQNFQKFKNLGLETRYEKKLDERFSYQLGASYSNPRQKQGDGSFIPVFNRLQFTSGLTFTENQWTVNLYSNYLAMRANDLKPFMPVNLTVKYKITDDSALTLAVDNLLNRQDITTNEAITSTSPAYYSLPRSFILSYSTRL